MGVLRRDLRTGVLEFWKQLFLGSSTSFATFHSCVIWGELFRLSVLWYSQSLFEGNHIVCGGVKIRKDAYSTQSSAWTIGITSTTLPGITCPFYRGSSQVPELLKDLPKVTVVAVEPTLPLQDATPLSLCHFSCEMRGLDKISWVLQVPLASMLLIGLLGLKS